MWDLDIKSDRAAKVEKGKKARSYNRSRWMAEIRSKGRSKRPRWTSRRRTGSSLRENFQEHTWFASPLAPPFLLSFFFLGSLFIYLLPFFGVLGFFSYPLAGHLPLRKGRLRCRIRGEGLGQRRGRRMRARWDGRRETIRLVERRMHRREKDGCGEQRGDRAYPSSGGNGLRPSLRSQLVVSMSAGWDSHPRESIRWCSLRLKIGSRKEWRSSQCMWITLD